MHCTVQPGRYACAGSPFCRLSPQGVPWRLMNFNGAHCARRSSVESRENATRYGGCGCGSYRAGRKMADPRKRATCKAPNSARRNSWPTWNSVSAEGRACHAKSWRIEIEVSDDCGCGWLLLILLLAVHYVHSHGPRRRLKRCSAELPATYCRRESTSSIP